MERGFHSPNTTPTPDALFDYWLPRLEGSDLRVTLCIVRHTFGWKKGEDDIAIGQFMRETGLGRRTVIRSLGKLVELGLIMKRRNPRPQTHMDDVNTYGLKIVDLRQLAERGALYTPNTTPVPDALFDYWLHKDHLSNTALKVLLYIIRRTLGFKKQADNIRPHQFTDGIRNRYGRVLDEGCGLKLSAVYNGLAELQGNGLVTVERRTHPRWGNQASRFALVFSGDLPYVLRREEIDPRSLDDTADEGKLDADDEWDHRWASSDGAGAGARKRAAHGMEEGVPGHGGEGATGRQRACLSMEEGAPPVGGGGATAWRREGAALDDGGPRGGLGYSGRLHPQQADSLQSRDRDQETPDQETNSQPTEQPQQQVRADVVKQARTGVVVLQTDNAIREYELADDEVFLVEEGTDGPGAAVRVVTLKELVQHDIEATERNWGIRVTTECYYSADHVLGTGPEEWTPDEQKKLEHRSALRRDLEAMYADTGAFTIEEALAAYFTADVVAALRTNDPAELDRQRGWVRYIRSEAGRNLTSPAGFLRKQLASRQWPPRGSPPPRHR